MRRGVGNETSRRQALDESGGPSAARDVRVVVVHFDRAGHVLGGDFTYIDVPTSRTTTAVVSTAQAPRVARVRVYVLPAR